MLRHGQKSGAALDWTFYCTLGRRGALDSEVRDLRARIVHSPFPIGEKLRFIAALRGELRRGGYDVLHCHHDLISAVYLSAAALLPIKRRIVHVHNADEAVLTSSPIKQAILRPALRRLCLVSADRVIGISNHTLDAFLSGRPRCQGRDLVHYYGVDPTPFRRVRPNREAFRRELGLPDDARLLLFAGRLVPEKNPLFAVDVLAALRQRDPAVRGLFVGAGALEQAVQSHAEALGVGTAIRVLGWRAEIADIMRVCDWFILPRPESPPEGFGLAVVEAQLAGLRLLLSRGIPDDPLLPRSRFHRLALADGAEAWAEAAMELSSGSEPSVADALEDLEKSPMNMDRAFRDLLALHGQSAFPQMQAYG